jgi:hypothetical protein
MRNLFACALLLSYTSLAVAVAQDATAPKLSPEPISSERMSIYRDFLSSYNNGSKSTLNVSQVTENLHSSDYDATGCLKDFKKSDFSLSVIHSFSPDAFPKEQVRLVNPKTHKRADPGDAIRKGASVDDAVDAGFASGLFTFSEIAFD